VSGRAAGAWLRGRRRRIRDTNVPQSSRPEVVDRTQDERRRHRLRSAPSSDIPGAAQVSPRRVSEGGEAMTPIDGRSGRHPLCVIARGHAKSHGPSPPRDRGCLRFIDVHQDINERRCGGRTGRRLRPRDRDDLRPADAASASPERAGSVSASACRERHGRHLSGCAGNRTVDPAEIPTLSTCAVRGGSARMT
jgi:hypothetical protein